VAWYSGSSGEQGAPEHLQKVREEFDQRNTLSSLIMRLQDHFEKNSDWAATSSAGSEEIAPFGDLVRTFECAFSVSESLNKEQLQDVASCYQRAISEVLELPPKEVLTALWQLLNLITLTFAKNGNVLANDQQAGVFGAVCSWLNACTPETARQIDVKALYQLWLMLKRDDCMGRNHEGLYTGIQHVALQCWRSGSLERQLFTLECIVEFSKNVNATKFFPGPRKGDRYNIMREGKSSWFTLVKIHRYSNYKDDYDLLWDGDSQTLIEQEMNFKDSVGYYVDDPCALSKRNFHDWLADNNIFEDLFGKLFHAQLLATKGTDFVVYMSRQKLLSDRHAKLMVLKAATVHESEKDHVHSLLLKVLKDLVPDSQMSLLRAILQLKPTDAMKILTSHTRDWWMSADLEPMVCGVLVEVLYQLMEAFMVQVPPRGVTLASLIWKRQATAEQGKYTKSLLSQCLALFTMMIPSPASLQERRDSMAGASEHGAAPSSTEGGGEEGLGRAASSAHEDGLEDHPDEGHHVEKLPNGVELGLSSSGSPKGQGVELGWSRQGDDADAEPLRMHYLRRILARTNQAIAQCDGVKLAYTMSAAAYVIADGAVVDGSAMGTQLAQAIPADFLDTLLGGIEAVLLHCVAAGGIDSSDYSNLEQLFKMSVASLHDQCALVDLGAGQLEVLCRLMSLSGRTKQMILEYIVAATTLNNASDELPGLALRHLCEVGRFEDYTPGTGMAFVHLLIVVNSGKLVVDQPSEKRLMMTAGDIAVVKSSSLEGLESVWEASLTASDEVAKSMCTLIARCFCVDDGCEVSHKDLLDRLNLSLQECIGAMRVSWDRAAIARQVRRLKFLLQVTQQAQRISPHRNASAGDEFSLEVINEAPSYAASLPGGRQTTSRADAAIQGAPEETIVNTACSIGALRRVMAQRMAVACADDIQLMLKRPGETTVTVPPSCDIWTMSEAGCGRGCQLVGKHSPDQPSQPNAAGCPCGSSFAHIITSDLSWCIYDALVELIAMAHTMGDEAAFCSLWEALVRFPTRNDLKAHLKEPSKVDWEALFLGVPEGGEPLGRAKASVLSLYRLQVLCSLLNPADVVETEKLTEAQEYHQHFMKDSPGAMRCVVRLFLSLPVMEAQSSSQQSSLGIQAPLVMEILQTCLHCLRLCVATRHLRCVGSVDLLSLPEKEGEKAGIESQTVTMKALLQVFRLQAVAPRCLSSGQACSRGAIDAMQVLKAMALASRDIALLVVQSSEILISGLIESPQDKVKECVYDMLMGLLAPNSWHDDHSIVARVLALMRLSIEALSEELLNGMVHPQKYNHALSLAHQLVETSQGSQGAVSEELGRTAVGLLRCIERHPGGAPDEILITRWLHLLDNLLLNSPWIMQPNGYGEHHVNALETAQFLFHECLHAFPTAELPTKRPKCLTVHARSAASELLLCLARGSSAVCEQLWKDLSRLHGKIHPLERWSEDPADNAVRQIGQASHVGLKNQGSTCYQNSVLQQIFMLPHVASRILAACRDTPMTSSAEGDNPDEESVSPQRALLAQLGVTLGYLHGSVATWYDPLSFVEASERALTLAHPVRRQNDASEFLHALVDSIDKAVEDTPYKSLLEDCFGGCRTTRVTAEVDGQVLTRPSTEDAFTVLELDVKGMSGVHEALADSIKDENLSGVLWDNFESPLDSVKRARVTSPPRHLALYLKRYVFDLQTLNYTRVNDRFEFPETLDMAPYMSTGEGAEDRGNVRYRLGGVLIQSGSVSAGHYYSFIRDRFSGEWYKFDDKAVTPYEKDLSLWLEQECFGGTRMMPDWKDSSMRMRQTEKSAYMLIYDREDVLSNMQPSVPIQSLHRASQTNEPSPKRRKAPDLMMDDDILASNVALMRHCFAHDAAHLTLLPKLSQVVSPLPHEGLPQQVHQVAGVFWLRHVIRLATPHSEGGTRVPGEAKVWAKSLLGIYEDGGARRALFSMPMEDWKATMLECPVQASREVVADFIGNVCGLIPSPPDPADEASLQMLWTSLIQVLDTAPGHSGRTTEFMTLLSRLVVPSAAHGDLMCKCARSAGLVWRVVRLLLGAERWQPSAADVFGASSKDHTISEELLGMGGCRDDVDIKKAHEVLSAVLHPVRELQSPSAQAVWLPELMLLMLREAPLGHAIEYSTAMTAASGVTNVEPLGGGFEVRLAQHLGEPRCYERCCQMLKTALSVEPASNQLSRASEVAETIVAAAYQRQIWDYVRGLAQLGSDIPRVREWLDKNPNNWAILVQHDGIFASWRRDLEVETPTDAQGFIDFVFRGSRLESASPNSSWGDDDDIAQGTLVNSVVDSFESIFPERKGESAIMTWAGDAIAAVAHLCHETEQANVEAAVNWLMTEHDEASLSFSPNKRQRFDHSPGVEQRVSGGKVTTPIVIHDEQDDVQPLMTPERQIGGNHHQLRRALCGEQMSLDIVPSSVEAMETQVDVGGNSSDDEAHVTTAHAPLA